MRLHLDEDLSATLLVQLLRKAGHDVQYPGEVGLSGESDAVHLTYAIRDDRVMLSRNYDDFLALHNLVQQARGHHPGILVVRRDNNTRRNMSPRDIAHAIRRLEAANLTMLDHYYALNPWQ